MIGMVFIMLLLVACQAPDADGQRDGDALTLELMDPVLQWRDGILGVVTGIAFSPSPEVLEALDHGVAVTLVVATRIHPVHGMLASNDQTRNHRFEIRYLPLIEHYQLTELKTGATATYPRLRLLVSALAEPRFLDTHLTQEATTDRSWHVQAKPDIDRERLPAPMQLAVWGDGQWQSSNDGWNWRVEVDDAP